MLQPSRHPDEVIRRGQQPLLVQHYLHHPEAYHAELTPGVAVGGAGAVGLDLLIAQVERIGLGQFGILALMGTRLHGLSFLRDRLSVLRYLPTKRQE
ncbi:hypothetical protein D3C75_1234900 [compost metagenome]